MPQYKNGSRFNRKQLNQIKELKGKGYEIPSPEPVEAPPVTSRASRPDLFESFKMGCASAYRKKLSPSPAGNDIADTNVIPNNTIASNGLADPSTAPDIDDRSGFAPRAPKSRR